METVDDVRAALADARVPGRRGAGDRRSSSRCACSGRCCSRARPGVGKTEVAKVLARWTGGELRPAAVLRGHRRRPGRLRVGLLPPAAAPARGRGRAASAVDEDELYSERFLVQAAAAAGASTHDGAVPPVLLIDEVDRADDEFEAFLLEILSDYDDHGARARHVRAPTCRRSWCSRRTAPATCTTRSKRRCLYHWIEHPDFEREVAIVRLRAPEVPELLAREVAAAVEALRGLELYKPPGRRRDDRLGRRRSPRSAAHELDEAAVDATLGTVLKYREDQERVRAARARRARPHGGGARCLTRRRAEPAPERDRASRSRGCCAAPGSTCRSARRSTFAEALGCVGLGDRARRVLGRRGRRSCTAPRTSRAYDRAFAVFWDAARGDVEPRRARRPSEVDASRSTSRRRRRPDGDDDGRRRPTRPSSRVRWSRAEVLRHRDFAAYTPAEFAEARRLMADLRLAGALAPLAPAAAVARATRGRPTCAARCARSLRAGGEPIAPRVPRRRRAARAALVLLLDVSGSMEPYARALRALPARRGRRARPGRGVRARHPPHPRHPRARRRAIPTPRCAAAARPGRRLVGRHPARRGRCARSTTSGAIRGMARGAVVVILSDGWDRGDPSVLAEQMARLAGSRTGSCG